MDHASAPLLLFVSIYHWMMADLAHALLAKMTLGTSIHLIFCPTILSGAFALLVKYLLALRVLPMCKFVSGSLLVLLVSWYIDRICRNNAFLLVRFVGLTIIFCAVMGIVIVSEDRFADNQPRVAVEAVTAGEFTVARD